jgi:glycosyltransferase involved in cell wall biosynthesis
VILKYVFKVNLCSAYGIYKPHFVAMLDAIERHESYPEIDAIISNDVLILPPALTVKEGLAKRFNKVVPLVGDMHEVHFDYGDKNKTQEKFRKWCCNSLLSKCEQLISVSEKLSKDYERYSSADRVMTIRSAPYFHDLEARPPGDKIKMVHVGGAQAERGLKEQIDVVSLLDSRYTLDLYLVSPTERMSKHIDELKQHIIDRGLRDRVSILPPVKSEDVVSTLNQYDIGLYYLKPTTGNHVYFLPNKFFEYIQAKLAVVITPIESMKLLLEQYDVGQIADNFELENFAEKVMLVGEKLDYYKQRSVIASKELHAERELAQLVAYFDATLG